jgi:hypothetical protein
MRLPALILAAFLTVAATTVPPPPVLQPYIKDGRFDPGDYRWMRGRFDDAGPADKAAFADVRKWMDGCFEAGREETAAELRAMGIAEPKLEQIDFRDGLCSTVAQMPWGIDLKSFAAFEQALAAARPVAETYVMAVGLAEEIGGPRGPTLADRLLARPLGEQMLRFGVAWGEGPLSRAPALTPPVKAIVIARIGAAMSERDRANTAWLKQTVEKEGWPKISQVGEPASQQAWLLVQHADADPAFQLKALRLMEPLVAQGEVSKSNYAYLYDRVMLKIAGKQRYATQAMCRAGKRIPQPLEDEAAVERLRAEAGLEPLPRYMQRLQAMAGDCPPDPPAAPAR